VKILGGGADHGRSADIDVLDQLFESHAGLGGGFFEGVKIYDDHVDRLDAMLGNSCDVCRIFTSVQDGAMNLGMQRFHTPIEHLGKSGELGDVLDGDAGIAEKFGGPSGREELDAEVGESTGEIDQAGFVGDAQDGALDFGHWTLGIERLIRF
jgi:hypothetical protein